MSDHEYQPSMDPNDQGECVICGSRPHTRIGPKTYTEAEVQAKVDAVVREALERAASLPIPIIPHSPALKAASDMLLAYQAAIRALIPEVPQ